VDYLVGLKENVILGHLIPAGTGFNVHQSAEVRINAPYPDGMPYMADGEATQEEQAVAEAVEGQ
jgi:DNA-directed RNA polymerase subunit beta'